MFMPQKRGVINPKKMFYEVKIKIHFIEINLINKKIFEVFSSIFLFNNGILIKITF